jgi:hypothetical protein
MINEPLRTLPHPEGKVQIKMAASAMAPAHSPRTSLILAEVACQRRVH